MHDRCNTMVRGFTLAEMVVVIAVTTIVGGVLLEVIRSFYVNNAYVVEATTAVYQARRGLTTALADLRESSYGDDGSYPIRAAATSSVLFYSDIDKDGGIEQVKIWRVGTTLYKVVTNAGGNPPTYAGQTSATSTIASALRNANTQPIFTYYDVVGAQLSTTSTPIADIAAVGIDIEIDLNPNRAPQLFTLTGKATLRNLKDQ